MGPENFLPIKLVLKTSCTLEAPAEPAASSTPHARNQPLYRLTKAVKYLVQRREKELKNAKELCQTLSASSHLCQMCCSLLGGPQTLMGQLRPVQNQQRAADSELAVTLSSCKLASSGWREGDSQGGCGAAHQQVMQRMDKHPEGMGWMVPAIPQRLILPGPVLIPVNPQRVIPSRSCPPPSPHAGVSAGSALIKRSRTIPSDLGLTFVKTYHSSSVLNLCTYNTEASDLSKHAQVLPEAELLILVPSQSHFKERNNVSGQCQQLTVPTRRGLMYLPLLQ